MNHAPVAVGIAAGQHDDVIGFALAEARRLDQPLRIVRVVDDSSSHREPPMDLGHDIEAALGEWAVERVTLAGDPATALLAEAQRSCRLVLASDHLARADAVTPDIAQRVALQAENPVVIFPMPPSQARASHVVVAVDDAHDLEGQLEYAFEAAEQRGEALEVVFGAGLLSDYPGRQIHASRLEDLLDRWRSRHPMVSTRVTVEGGHPVESCLAVAVHASLMVVGRPVSKHPRVGARSVAARILRRALVPIAVVPTDYIANGVRDPTSA